MSTNSTSKRKKGNSEGSESSLSKSPEEKKSRNLSNPEENLKEDEVFKALNMADSVGSKLESIISKLDKLSTIETKLDGVTTSLQQIEEKVRKLDTDVILLDGKYKAINDLINEMDKGLFFLNNENEDLKKWRKIVDKGMESLNKDVESSKKWKEEYAAEISKVAADSKQETQEVRQSINYFQAYSRRENLKFVGIEEEESEDTKQVLTDFLEETLGLDNAYDIEYQRVHRQSKGKPGKPRTIIARFLRYTDVERILRRARNLKGTKYIIFQDFPKVIEDARKKQIGALKEAKKQGKKAVFSRSEPDKLYIDGQLYLHDLVSNETQGRAAWS